MLCGGAVAGKKKRLNLTQTNVIVDPFSIFLNDFQRSAQAHVRAVTSGSRDVLPLRIMLTVYIHIIIRPK